MPRKFRLFRGRIIGMSIASFVAGTQAVLYFYFVSSSKDTFGSLLGLFLMVLIFISQMISQYMENRQHTTVDEFKSASIIKIDLFSKVMHVSMNRFLISMGALFILGVQITLLIVNFEQKEPLISAIVGTLAMCSLLAYQISGHLNDQKKLTEN